MQTRMAICVNRWQLKKMAIDCHTLSILSIDHAGTITDSNIPVFTVTADFLARLLAIFLRQ